MLPLPPKVIYSLQMISWYRVCLALHIVSFVSWMAGVLYLFRLFVYHAQETEAVVKERFKIMERKLYSYITVPAMVSTVLFGGVMIAQVPSYLSASWMLLKLAFVGALVAVTLYGGMVRIELELGDCKKDHKFFRWMNEVPTLLMIVIVFLVILRPFG